MSAAFAFEAGKEGREVGVAEQLADDEAAAGFRTRASSRSAAPVGDLAEDR